MDSSHVPNQLWSAEHVMNPNIKEVIDIPSGIFGDLGHFFDLEISDTAGSAVKASAWQSGDSQFEPHLPPIKKKNCLSTLGVYIRGYIYK